MGQHVVDGGPVHGLLHELTELGGRRVAAHAEADPDLAEPVADLVGQAEDPSQVDVALDPRLDRLQRDLADRGDVAQARGQTGGQRRKQDLRRVGAVSSPTSTAGWSASMAKVVACLLPPTPKNELL